MRAAVALFCFAAGAACGGKARRDAAEPARLVAIRAPEGALGGSWSALSEDGRTVVGTASVGSSVSDVELVPVVWTLESGARRLRPSPAREASLADVNGDGTLIGGITNAFGSYQPFVWAEDEITYVPHAGSLEAMSADGRFVAGRFLYKPDFLHAYLWSEEHGQVDLGTIEGEAHSSATGVSDDGEIVVGMSGETAFRWTRADGMKPLPLLPGDTRSHAVDLSRDGRVVVGGTGTFEDAASTITLWTDEDVEELEGLPGALLSQASACNALGTIVVGQSGEAFIWSRAEGSRAISEVLVEAGADLSGWTLSEAVDVSGDGSVVLGKGELEGEPAWWVAWLPRG